jgi:hypothetical protein
LKEVKAEEILGKLRTLGIWDGCNRFPDKWPDWKVENGRMYHLRLDQLGKVIPGTTDKWKLVVPLDFRARVLEENHDLPHEGHLGITKTFLRISQDFYWPGLFRDVVKYVNLMMEAVRTSETSVDNLFTRQYNPVSCFTHLEECVILKDDSVF